MVAIFVLNSNPGCLFFPLGCVSGLNPVDKSYFYVNKTNACLVLMVIAFAVFWWLLVVSDVLLLSFLSVRKGRNRLSTIAWLSFG